ncbi:cytochrome P450 724B1-like [Lycium barbarum]|uniref:cytochrome P450 724B1-like n=1 Tax=Lycium barbarum TaxID=112863 RepID=UPI00293F4B55|nr:cytochrome P450 724B1-like [Lycium barbarum]
MDLPFVGETFGFFTPHKSFSIGNFLQKHRSRYEQVCKSYLFRSPTIVSCDLALNRFVLQNEGKLFQSSYPKSVRDILDKHALMLVTDADLHKKFRSIEIGLINKFKYTPDSLSNIDKLCVSLMESWRGNQLVLFSKESKQFSFNLMLMDLLDMQPGEPLGLQLLEDFLTFMKGLISIPINLPWTPYARALKVVNETLRCGNLVKFVHRETIKDVEFKDPATSKKVIPFGGGLRLCPGSELAKLEATFFLHHLVLNYRWTVKEDDYPMPYPYMEFPRGLLIALEAETTEF